MMYIKLIIRLNDHKIVFQAHEIVRIAHDVMENYAFPEDIATQVFIPEPPIYKAFISKMVEKITDIGVIEGRIDPYITIPMHIGGLDTVAKWLYTAKKLRDLYVEDCAKHPLLSAYKPQEDAEMISEKDLKRLLVEDVSEFVLTMDEQGKVRDFNPVGIPKKTELSQGTWIKIAERLVLVKNTAEMTYYVSDHGKIADIIAKVIDLAFGFNWTDAHLAQAVVAMYKTIESMTSEELTAFKAKAIKEMPVITPEAIAFMKSQPQHAGLSEDAIYEIAKNSAETFSKNPILSFIELDESNRYIIHSLIKKYMQMKFSSKPNFDHEIFHDFYVYDENGDPIEDDMIIDGVYKPWAARLEDSYNLIKRMVLLEVANDVNFGLHEPLFRPVTSYGDRDYGPSYFVFADSIRDYCSSEANFSDAQIAFAMRDILRGGVPELGTANFIPSLIGAWFIAEPIRNPLSVLSGLIMLDMIESGIILHDSNHNNWYSLYHSLIHPLKDSGVKKVPDLYGSKDGIDRFGGSHPMAHGGSVAESVLPEDGKKLTSVRQKEASLYFHWLKLRFEKLGIECFLVSAEEEALKVADVKILNLEQAQKQHLEAVEALNKRVLAAEKDSKLSKSDESKVKALKKLEHLESEIAALNTRFEEIKHKLLFKENAVTEYIAPLLHDRLNTLDNLLVSTEQDVVARTGEGSSFESFESIV
jgi:hypothetical protein